MPKSLFFSLSVFSQKTITGVGSDTLNQPLESANLIAKPLQEKAGIKFENKPKMSNFDSRRNSQNSLICCTNKTISIIKYIC